MYKSDVQLYIWHMEPFSLPCNKIVWVHLFINWNTSNSVMSALCDPISVRLIMIELKNVCNMVLNNQFYQLLNKTRMNKV